MWLVALVNFAYVLRTEYFSFLVGHGKDLERKEGFRPVRKRSFHSESMEAIREPCAKSSFRRGVPTYSEDKQQRRLCRLAMVLQKISQKMYAVLWMMEDSSELK